jgi:hypothetical protein
MVLRKLTGVFSIALVIGAATFAVAGVPDLQLSTAVTAAGAGVTPVMYNLPNGAGSAFAVAGTTTGGTTNATITLTVLDGAGVPVFNYSAADMYLVPVAAAGNFFACANGTIATFNTNASGITRWDAPLRAGGWNSGLTKVVISGAALTSNLGLVLRHNSSDLSGDGIVDLVDLGAFAGDFYGGLNPFRADLQADGLVDLGDLGVLASGIGTSCPQ